MKISDTKDKAKKMLPFMKRAAIGTVGFILSPLSWWNDVFVNFPLAYGFAWGFGKFVNVFTAVHGWLFIGLFIGGYFLTNLLGFLMIHYSVFYPGKEQSFSIRKQLLVSLFYTLLIVLFFGLDICRPEEGCKIFPPWVVP
jgi:hypothetical protein